MLPFPPGGYARACRHGASRARTIAALTLAISAGCAEDTRAIDPFPIRIDLSRGAVALAVDAGDGPVPAIIDTATPLTVVDPFEAGRTTPAPRRSNLTVTLIGLDDNGEPTIPRARFPSTAALELHPCPADGLCQIGKAGETVEFRAIVGADILARSAARVDFPTSELRFFPDTSGNAAQLTDECHAVIGRAFAGGGTLLVGGTEVNYGGWRPVVGACLNNARDDVVDGDGRPVERGTDALFVISTGLKITVLAASAYERYAAAAAAPALDSLSPAVLHLPSGPADVRIGHVGTVALVGSLGNGGEDQADRGPCREFYLNRVMSEGFCNPSRVGAINPCPCPNEEQFCTTAAAVDLGRPIGRQIEVAVLDDGHPVLQALRDELRPETPELDGLLGTAALEDLRLELDYLNNRMLMRCEVLGDCKTLPSVRSQQALDALASCREREAVPDAGPGEGPDGGVDAGADAAPE